MKPLTKRSKTALMDFISFSLLYTADKTGLTLDSEEMKQQARFMDILYKEFIKTHDKS